MARTYTEELVYAESEDGIILEGAVIQPAFGPARPVAVLWVHGYTSRFSFPRIIPIGRELANGGYVFVTGNNRGHDFGAGLWHQEGGPPGIGGAAWERFEECPRDIAPWIKFTVELGFRGVALLGHSLGALKVVYYQAERQDPRVVGLIIASPPVQTVIQKAELVDLAERMVAEGRGLDLLPWGSTSKTTALNTVSAQTYLSRARVNMDLYGRVTPNPAISRVYCPILTFYGTNNDIGVPEELEMLRRNATGAPRVETRLFQGADHDYTGCSGDVAAAIAAWADSLDAG